MRVAIRDTFTPLELATLSSIVHVGDAIFRDLLETEQPLFAHPYLRDIRGRIRTKLVQMQCEIESHDPKFPFKFDQREFRYKHIVPELRNKNVILHIARSTSPDRLPHTAAYKVALSNNNHAIERQVSFDMNATPPYGDIPYYGILTFGGRKQTFTTIQFPEPGYTQIAERLDLPQIILSDKSEDEQIFERKKAVLKKEFLSHGAEEVIS